MKYISILLLCLFNLTLIAQENDSLSSSLLWEIKGKNIQQPSYLLGTMHMMPKDDFLFPDHLQDKLMSTELLVMELESLDDGSNAGRYMFLDSGNVFNLFEKNQLDSLFAFTTEELNYNEAQIRMIFSDMKPFVLMQLILQGAFGEHPVSYEIILSKLAEENNMKIKGLETMEKQASLFDKIPLEEQVRMLMETLKKQQEAKTKGMNPADELVKVFLRQDIDSIFHYTISDGTDITMLEHEFLTNRNVEWVRKIKKLIKRKACFIAVGAAHLGGPNGVVQLLRNEGYVLIPIKL
jgi:uncharacterized protein YbaP (TraB family)